MFSSRVTLGFPDGKVPIQFVVLPTRYLGMTQNMDNSLAFFTAIQSVKPSSSEMGTRVPSTTALILLLTSEGSRG